MSENRGVLGSIPSLAISTLPAWGPSGVALRKGILTRGRGRYRPAAGRPYASDVMLRSSPSVDISRAAAADGHRALKSSGAKPLRRAAPLNTRWVDGFAALPPPASR